MWELPGIEVDLFDNEYSYTYVLFVALSYIALDYSDNGYAPCYPRRTVMKMLAR